MARNRLGRFAREHVPWTPEKWDDGYVDGDGRFRVYRPDYPGAYTGGYALRAHIVWWLATGQVCSGNDLELHHKDHNRLNDRLPNLERISHAEHVKRHHPVRFADCEQCHRPFAQGDRPRRFCSQSCFHRFRIGRPRPHRKPPVTHCKHGHLYDEANTVWTPQGKRQCRTCKNARQNAAYHERRRKAA